MLLDESVALSIHEAGHLVIGIADGGRPRCFRRYRERGKTPPEGALISWSVRPIDSRPMYAAGLAANRLAAAQHADLLPLGDLLAESRAHIDLERWVALGFGNEDAFDAMAEVVEQRLASSLHGPLATMAEALRGRKYVGRRELSNIAAGRQTSKIQFYADLVEEYWKTGLMLLALTILVGTLALHDPPKPVDGTTVPTLPPLPDFVRK